MRIFRRLRLFDFYNQVGFPPDLAGALRDTGARLHVFTVGDRASLAGLGFYQHLMTGLAKGYHTSRHQTDAGFVVFHLFRNSDDHARILTSSSAALSRAVSITKDSIDLL